MGILLLKRGLNSVRGVLGASAGLERGERTSEGIIVVRGGFKLVDARAIEARVGVSSELRTPALGRAIADFGLVWRFWGVVSGLSCFTRFADGVVGVGACCVALAGEFLLSGSSRRALELVLLRVF